MSLSQVLSNCRLSWTTNGATINTTNRLLVTASASDVGGTMRRVDIYLRHHHEFGIGDLVASDATAPFDADWACSRPSIG